MRTIKEGLTIYQTPPEPIKVPYPEPIKVTDSLSLRRARIKGLFQILLKKIELMHTMRLSLNKINNPQMRELIWKNIRRQEMEIDEVWLQLRIEMREYHSLIAKRLKAITGV